MTFLKTFTRYRDYKIRCCDKDSVSLPKQKMIYRNVESIKFKNPEKYLVNFFECWDYFLRRIFIFIRRVFKNLFSPSSVIHLSESLLSVDGVYVGSETNQLILPRQSLRTGSITARDMLNLYYSPVYIRLLVEYC